MMKNGQGVKWEVILGAPERANIPCLMRDTRLYQFNVCLCLNFYIPSTARSFRDGTPIYCLLRRTCSSVNTPFPTGFEPRAVAWSSIMLPLRHESSQCNVKMTNNWNGTKHICKYKTCYNVKNSRT